MAKVDIKWLTGACPKIECVTDFKDTAEILSKTTATLEVYKDTINNHSDVLAALANGSWSNYKRILLLGLIAGGALGGVISLTKHVGDIEARLGAIEGKSNNEPELDKENE